MAEKNPSLNAKIRPWNQVLWPTMAFFMGFAGLSIYGPLVPKFVQLMHLSPLKAGILAAVPNLSGALLRIPFGAWTDRVGFKRPFQILLVSAFLGIVGVIWLMRIYYPMHMDRLFGVLLLLGALVGAGIATFPVGIAQVSYAVTDGSQGVWLASYAGLGNLAPGLFAVLLPYAFAREGVMGSYALWAVCLAVVTILYTVKSPRISLLGPMASSRPLSSAFLTPATWPLTFLYFVSFGGFLALVAWLPEFFSANYHVALVSAGLFTLIFTVITSLIRILGGWLADQISPRAVIVGALAVMALAAGVISDASSLSWALGGTWLMGVGMGIQNGAVFKMVPFVIPNAVGGASGIIGGLGALGGFLIPPVMAVMGGSRHGSTGFFVFLGLALVGLGVIRYIRLSSPPRSQNPQRFPAELDC
ncbi:MAG: MFS transporter [Firmicutes bacterium]|jgi:NNP family nitrate/nitrite transporter-like MFS transporter|nr:MFS transporter [Bacillota bacterium]MCL5015431.1 MFS transporter [Bacillota bacterium]